MNAADNPLVRAVGRLPTTLSRKLLVAMVGTVVLLVVLGVLGLGVLSASNKRVGSLGNLQIRTAAYQELQTDASQLRNLQALRAGGPDLGVYTNGGQPTPPRDVGPIDDTIDSSLTLLGTAIDPKTLTFAPPAAEAAILGRVRSAYTKLSSVTKQMIEYDNAKNTNAGLALQRTQGLPLSNELVDLTNGLVADIKRTTSSVIAQNATAFANSQTLFIAVAGGSIVLALMLGFVLSWSFIDPIRKIDSRLEAIAAGDFSGHVEVPNRDELGALAANLNRMNDELGRLYKELETVSRHKSEFLAGMSHELRTPLNAIIGFSEVLGEKMFGELNDRQAEYVGDIQTSGRHLLSLINDILDLSKVEAGKMELELGPVSIADALASGVTMQRERAISHGITLSLNVPDEIAPIPADERKVRQVVFNLLSNAVKFTPDGGRIDVGARIVDGMVEVSVADTGVGIAPEDTERIFEEFQQVGGPSAGRHEGTGLGLALARKFVEMHGGHLSVSSASARGSTFTFTLPATRAEVPA